MNSIVLWSVKFRRMIIAIAAGLLIYGLLQLDSVERDILPEFSPTRVEVQTEALGLSAAGVEQLITVPLEQDLLNGVAFLETIESASLPGLSSVVMTFESGTDLLDARQVVAERLTQAAGLPQVSDPPQMIQPLSSTSRVAIVSLTPTEGSLIETSVLAQWVMVPRLLGVKGVANVAIWGFRDQQLQVLVDPTELANRNVSLSQVIATTGNALEVSPLSFLEASSPGTGGFIDTVNQRLHVFHEQAISTPDELAEVTLEGVEGGAVFVEGEPLTLGDVADVVTDHQPLIGDASCDKGPCILLVIEKFPGANTPEVAAGIEEALDALSLGLPGIAIDTSIYQPAAFIDASLDNLRAALLVGGLLLMLALAALLFDWRTVVIGIASIATSLVVAGVVLLLFEVTVNAMVLAGLVMALVVIVDDAIVGAWGAADHEADGETEPIGVLTAIVESIVRFRSIALYGALIVVALMVPVIAMEGEAGAFLEPIASAYLLAVAASIVVSVTVAPALSVLLLANAPSGRRTSPLAARLRNWYGGIAPELVARTGRAVAIFGVFIVAGLVAITFISPSLRPALKERDILIQLEAAPGTSLARMNDVTAEIAGALRSQTGIAVVGAHVGRAIMSDQVVNVNSAEVWLNVDPSADYRQTIDAIESVVDGYTEVTSEVTTYSAQRVTEILDQPDDRLIVRVYGENPAIRQTMAERVRSTIGGVEGIENPRIEAVAEEPTVEIEVDLASAQAFGVKPGDVRRQAATLVSGLVVGNLFEDQKVFDVVVWGVPGIRDTVEHIRAMPIATPSGDQVPLGSVADVRIVSSPSVIRHESVASFLDVAAGVKGRSLGSTAADVDAALSEIAFPLEHHAEILGGFAEVEAAQARVNAAAIAALILVYLLLQAAFTSWRLATLAVLLLPMAVSGSVIAIAVTGGELTLGSIAGIVGVFGLAARSVVLAIRSYERRERLGGAFGLDLVVAETTRLLIPIAVSTVAIVALFVPLAVSGSQAGVELGGPMAVAVLGGLITTVFLLVLVLPTVYLRWGYVAQLETSADDLLAPHLPVAATVGG